MRCLTGSNLDGFFFLTAQPERTQISGAQNRLSKSFEPIFIFDPAYNPW
jgi:hypothetical protein